MKFIVLITFIGFMQFSFAQELTYEQTKSREIAQKVAKEYFGKDFKQKKIAIFSSGDEQFTILEKRNKNTYYQVKAKYSKDRIDLISDTLFTDTSDLLQKIFDTSKYKKSFVTFSSDLYKDGYEMARGNISYFVLFYEGERYGELRLSVFVIPVPFDPEIYYYFVESLLIN